MVKDTAFILGKVNINGETFQAKMELTIPTGKREGLDFSGEPRLSFKVVHQDKSFQDFITSTLGTPWKSRSAVELLGDPGAHWGASEDKTVPHYFVPCPICRKYVPILDTGFDCSACGHHIDREEFNVFNDPGRTVDPEYKVDEMKVAREIMVKKNAPVVRCTYCTEPAFKEFSYFGNWVPLCLAHNPKKPTRCRPVGGFNE